MTTPLTRLGLGLAALGRPAYITTGREALGAARSVDDLRAQTSVVLDAAYAAGVRYVDTARSYGHAEEFLAAWLGSRPEVDDVVVASKWGYRYVGDWQRDAEVHEVKDHSAAAFIEQLELSRDLLGERLATYQVHSLMPDDPLFADRAALDGLAGLRDSGVRVGFSTSGPRQAETVRRALAVDVGGPLFSVVQSTWNLLETSVGPALAEAHDAGLDVVVKEGVANGRLAPGSDDPAEAALAARAVADELGVADALGVGDELGVADALVVADAPGVGVDAVALAVVLAQPWAPRVLSGAVTVEQLEANLAATRLDLDADTLARLTAAPEDPGAYWAQRSARPWR